MRSRNAALAVALIAAAAAVVHAAQARPGVGYDPRALGHVISSYWVQDPSTGRLSQRSHAIDFGVASPLGSPAEFERRWGPGSYTRKKWVGPDNELVATVAAAMEWAFRNQPALLGVSNPGGLNGKPTAIEVTDACATNHGTALVVAYAQAEWPGGSPDRPIVISDAAKPPGDFTERNPYWPVTTYYHNTFRGFLPVSPQVPLDPAGR